jgi:flagellar biosynthetic protein FlhB
MAEEHDQEKTLPATPRRLEQAREEGQVARSREFTSAALMLSAAAGALWGGQAMSGWFSTLLTRGLTIDRKAAFDMPVALDRAGNLALDALVMLLPALGLLAAVAMFAPLALGGWLFTTKPLMPNFGRMSPGRWIGQLFSFHGAAELVKSIAKAAVITVAALVMLWNSRVDIAMLLSGSASEAISHAARLAGWGFFAAAAAMLLIAAIDVPSQLWQHHKALRMSAEEVRREMKESEGDPHIKQRIRTQQREMARRRMMSDVPKADVVVTNPTHFAVAIAWKEGAMRAPRVLAKGSDAVAARIREIAAENGVPVLEAPPLARALHKHAEIGAEIPAPLYNAVAQVLAWVYSLRASESSGRPLPLEPEDFLVPAELDPGVEGVTAA